MKIYKPKTLAWFIARVGKRVFRDFFKCCETCEGIARNGIVIADKNHASYLATIDSDFASCGAFMNYRDRK